MGKSNHFFFCANGHNFHTLVDSDDVKIKVENKIVYAFDQTSEKKKTHK